MLVRTVQRYFEQGLRSYADTSKRFHHFCSMYGIITSLPVCEYTLCGFASHLADESLTPQTIEAYLSVVRNLQLMIGLPDPCDQRSLPILKRVLAGISRTYARAHRGPPHLPLAITAQILTCIHALLLNSPIPAF